MDVDKDTYIDPYQNADLKLAAAKTAYWNALAGLISMPKTIIDSAAIVIVLVVVVSLLVIVVALFAVAVLILWLASLVERLWHRTVGGWLARRRARKRFKAYNRLRRGHSTSPIPS